MLEKMFLEIFGKSFSGKLWKKSFLKILEKLFLENFGKTVSGKFWKNCFWKILEKLFLVNFGKTHSGKNFLRSFPKFFFVENFRKYFIMFKYIHPRGRARAKYRPSFYTGGGVYTVVQTNPIFFAPPGG